MVDVSLREDGDNGLTVGGIVHVGGCEEFVHLTSSLKKHVFSN